MADNVAGLLHGAELLEVVAVTGVALIPALLMSSHPSAILGGVRTIVVDPVNGVTQRWSNTHVSEEILERIEPAGADRDAAPSIVVVPRCRGIQAPPFHGTPDRVFGRLEAAVPGRPVFCYSFSLKASTTALLTGSQIVAVSQAQRSALASAKPNSLHALIRTTRNDGQSAELTANQVYEFHPILSNVVRHSIAGHGG